MVDFCFIFSRLGRVFAKSEQTTIFEPEHPMTAKDPTKPASRTARKQLLLHLRPETILKLKSEALHANRYAYEIVQELLDEHFSQKGTQEKAVDES